MGDVKNLNPRFLFFFCFVYSLTRVVTKTFFFFDNTGRCRKRQLTCPLQCSVELLMKRKNKNILQTETKKKKKINARIHTKHTLKRQLFTNILHYKNLILNFSYEQCSGEITS